MGGQGVGGVWNGGVLEVINYVLVPTTYLATVETPTLLLQNILLLAE